MVKETEAQLTDELAEVCRDYCFEAWTEALNVARDPADSKWRKAENVNYPADLREAPEATLGLGTSATPTVIATEKPSTTQASLPPPKTYERPGKAGDHGQGLEVAKGKKAGQRRRLKVRRLKP